jgi:phospholipid/cholesterol/gamma-HCH transport system substrate-binding protein
MRRRAVAFIAFAAVSILLTIYIVNMISPFNFGVKRYTLSATFDDVTNLQAGDPVRLAGVPVGAVGSVRAVAGKARVSFNIDRNVKLPTDSTVAVQWRSLIGQRELYLYPGTSKVRLGAGGIVKSTKSEVDVGALINSLGTLTSAVNPQEVNKLVEALATSLSGNRQNVKELVDNLQTVLATLAQRKATISQLLTDYQRIANAVSTRDAQIGQVIDQLSNLSTTFGDSRTILDNALVKLPATAQGLQQLLEASSGNLGQIITSLATVTGVVNQHLPALKVTLEKLPDAAQVLFEINRSGTYLTVNVLCLAIAAPPSCLHPILIPASVPNGGPLTSPPSFSRVLVGVDT